MKRNQKSTTNNIQNILIPMEIFHVTQGDNEGNHKGINATDLAGKDTGRDVAYFPFDAVCVATNSSDGNAVWWQSTNAVRFADGTIDYCTMMILHDNNLNGIYVGAQYAQGQQMAQEGTAGYATGNHLHIEFAKGKFQRQYNKNAYGVYHLPNSLPMESVCFADDTIFKNGANWNWKYTKGITSNPTPSSNKKLFLPASATSWYVYPTNKAPVVGNQGGILTPAKFGGLSYDILDTPLSNVATIQTSSFGKVNIYIAPKTGAIIK